MFEQRGKQGEGWTLKRTPNAEGLSKAVNTYGTGTHLLSRAIMSTLNTAKATPLLSSPFIPPGLLSLDMILRGSFLLATHLFS